MKIIKSEWVHHDGNQILSLDIDPTAQRIATGGRGDSAGKICIWGTSQSQSNDQKCKKNKIINVKSISDMVKLAELGEHSGSVNCVRWSKSGDYLASGGDDCNVIIWSMKKMKTYSSDDHWNRREMWKTVYHLQAHTGDVLDIAWSNCRSFLASASVDNSIIIWNAKCFPEIVTKLNKHTSFVKGLSWDPVGEYLASQSDDRTVMIWPTLKFGDKSHTIKPTAIIEKPFKDASAITQFLRLSWSPDGQYLVTGHAFNNAAPVSKIIERNTWTYENDCVGHRAAVGSVAFNSKVYTNDNNTSEFSMICALGCRDGSISIWKFPNSRPIAVLHQLFISSIVDMCWTKNGDILCVVSSDGNVGFCKFDAPKEMGSRALTSLEISNLHKNLYGINILNAFEVPEIPMSYQFVDKKKNENHLSDNQSLTTDEEHTKKFSKAQETNFQKEKTFQSKITEEIKQKETISKDGRKRIQPILLAAPVDESPFKCAAAQQEAEMRIKKPKSLKLKNWRNGENESSSSCGGSTHFVIKRNISNNDSFATPTPLKNIEFSVLVDGVSLTVFVDNVQKTAKPKTYELRAVKNNITVWQFYLLGRVTIYRNNRELFALITEDNRLHIFNYNGWRVFPQIALSKIAACLFLDSSKYVSVVSVCGDVTAWDIEMRSCVLKDIKLPTEKLDDSFDKEETSILKTLKVIDEKIIIAIYTNYNVFVYDRNLSSWISVIDKMFYFSKSYPSLSIGSIINDLCLSENIGGFYDAKKSELKMQENTNEFIQGTTTFLLNLLNAYMTIGCIQKFDLTFQILVNHLVEHNQFAIIENICSELSSNSMMNVDDLNTCLGKNSAYYLDELLKIIADKKSVQHIYSLYRTLN